MLMIRRPQRRPLQPGHRHHHLPPRQRL